MRRLSLGVSSLMAVLIPLSVIAADMPSVLLLQLNNDHSPYRMTGEVHGNSNGVYVAMWIKSDAEIQEGHDLRGTASVTADVAYQDMTARAKIQMRFVDDRFYFMIESITGNMDNELMEAMAQFKMKQWVYVSMDDLPGGQDIRRDQLDSLLGFFGRSIHEAESMSEEEMNALIGAIYDAVFTMQKNGNTYNLNLQRHFMQDAIAVINRALGTANTEYSQFEFFGIEDIEREILQKLKIGLTIQTTSGDRVNSVTADMSYNDGNASGTFHSVLQKLSAPVSVAAPANAIDLEEYMNKLFEGVAGVNPFAITDREIEYYDEPFEEESYDSYDSYEYPETDSYGDCSSLAVIRKGGCNQRESKRTLNTRLR